MEKVEQIKTKVEALIEEAIAILEKNYDMDNVDVTNSAYMTMMDLNGALIELDYIDNEGLKIKE